MHREFGALNSGRYCLERNIARKPDRHVSRLDVNAAPVREDGIPKTPRQVYTQRVLLATYSITKTRVSPAYVVGYVHVTVTEFKPSETVYSDGDSLSSTSAWTPAISMPSVQSVGISMKAVLDSLSHTTLAARARPGPRRPQG